MSIIGNYLPKLVKYFTAVFVLVRCSTVFVMFHLIEVNQAGVSNDRKLMVDGITNVLYPWLMIVRLEPKIDLFLTPFMLLANHQTIVKSLDEKDGSMACFSDPDEYLQLQIFRLNTVLALAVYIAFVNRRSALTLFFEQRKAVQQQSYL